MHIGAQVDRNLITFEKHAGIGPVAASRLIGCAYATYAQYRSGLRPVPKYHKQHVEQLMRVDARLLAEFILEYCHGKS
jgi:hypothetical protein